MTSDIEKLLEERSKTHGDYQEFSFVVQSIKRIIYNYLEDSYKQLIPEQQESLDMVVHKIGRIVTGDPMVADHWDDGAGYFTLGRKAIRSIKNNEQINRETTREGQATTAQAKPYCEGLKDAEVPSEDYFGAYPASLYPIQERRKSDAMGR